MKEMSLLVMFAFFALLAIATYGACSLIAWIGGKIEKLVKNNSRHEQS